jgi:hypothetical protein
MSSERLAPDLGVHVAAEMAVVRAVVIDDRPLAGDTASLRLV